MTYQYLSIIVTQLHTVSLFLVVVLEEPLQLFLVQLAPSMMLNDQHPAQFAGYTNSVMTILESMHYRIALVAHSVPVAQRIAVSTHLLHVPRGSYPNISDGVATCVPCQPGNACPNGGILWACPEGFIASMPGVTNCTMCPAGFKCPAASSGPVECADDQYSLRGETECHDCPEGFT